MSTYLDVWQRVGAIVGDPLMAHGAGQADTVLRVLVQQAQQQVLHGVAHEDVLREGEGGVADLVVETQDGVRLEGHCACRYTSPTLSNQHCCWPDSTHTAIVICIANSLVTISVFTILHIRNHCCMQGWSAGLFRF